MKIDWKKKLTSRKLWAAVVSFVSLLVVALGGSQELAAQVTALIMAGATVVAYIVGEGLVDAASAGAQATTPSAEAVIGTVEDTPCDNGSGAAQAAEVKANTSESSK
jgi:uncharacterized membrane protein